MAHPHMPVMVISCEHFEEDGFLNMKDSYVLIQISQTKEHAPWAMWCQLGVFWEELTPQILRIGLRFYKVYIASQTVLTTF